MSAPTDVVERPVFVCAVPRAHQVGPVAPWITMASWARAAEAVHGAATVATVEGLLAPDEALARAASGTRRAEATHTWRRRIPAPVTTLVKDARRIPANRAFARSLQEQVRGRVPYVFQLHGLFWDAGLRLARALGVPSVLVVDACQVEEARSWGVKRPGWSHLAEQFGERPQLTTADLVVCVSDEVARSVRALTGRTDGVVVLPNGVDVGRFVPAPRDPELVRRYDLADRFVVGWAGSFRSFHGLDSLLDAAGRLQRSASRARLLLVGDGLERPAVEARARALGVDAVFTGTVPYLDVPAHLRLMDVGVVLAGNAAFHYSPVKLRELQACGVPVLASAVGEMQRTLHDGVDALLAPPDDVDALTAGLARLLDDAGLRAALAAEGRAIVERDGSWTARLAAVESLLAEQTRA